MNSKSSIASCSSTDEGAVKPVAHAQLATEDGPYAGTIKLEERGTLSSAARSNTQKNSQNAVISISSWEKENSTTQPKSQANTVDQLVANTHERRGETLPTPPNLKNVIQPTAKTVASDNQPHPLLNTVDGPSLIGPVPTTVSASQTPSDTPVLKRDSTNDRKQSNFAATSVTSPRRISQRDDEQGVIEPPPTSQGNAATDGPDDAVDLEPLLSPGGDAGLDPDAAPPLLTAPTVPPGRAPGASSAPNLDDQKLGEAPEDTSLRFLRQQTVLLKPGEMQFDVTFEYVNDKIDFVSLRVEDDVIQIAESEARQRLLLAPLQLRVGICDYTQAFVGMAFGWANSEVEFLGQDQAKSSGGIGDVNAGIVKQLVVGNEYYPDVLATVSFSAPTGDSEFVTALATPGSNLGLGFWTTTAGLTFIQNYDPLVLFYGAGYTYRFQNKFDGLYKVDPGAIAFYRFGVGFAVNPNVTLSAAFLGSFIGESELNGEYIGGSAQEPMQIRLAATINKRKTSKTHSSVKLVEPFVTFGMNDDAIDSIIGITWTH